MRPSAQRLGGSDLRLRFGLIMAVALLPLLLFSMWQSVIDYRRATEETRRATTAALEVAELGILGITDNANDALRFLALNVEDQDCEEIFDKVVDRTPEVSNVAMIDPSGQIVCSDTPIETSRKVPEIISGLSADNPISYTLVIPKGRERDTKRFIMARADYVDDQTRIFTARLVWTSLWTTFRSLRTDLGVDVTLFTADGDSIFQSQPSKFTLEGSLLKEVLKLDADQEYTVNILTSDNQKRRITIRKSPVNSLYIAVSEPRTSYLSWQAINLLTGSIIPLLAWLFAFAAIWFAADRLILKHLRQLRGAALNFATGNMDERVGHLPDAPEQILQLGRTFDLMADRISDREADLLGNIEEKEVLLREIHHRVKNNLQIIISLLNMQQRDLKDPEGRVAIEEARNRINAIALVHRSLYESDDLGDVEMQPFLDKLVGDIYRSLEGNARGITLNTQIDAVDFDADKAIPIALFVVETLSNAMKHGTPDGGDITVSFQVGDMFTPDGEADAPAQRILTVRDSGPGPSKESASATGQRLIKGFTRQLGGTLTSEHNDSGYQVKLSF